MWTPEHAPHDATTHHKLDDTLYLTVDLEWIMTTYCRFSWFIEDWIKFGFVFRHSLNLGCINLSRSYLDSNHTVHTVYIQCKHHVISKKVPKSFQALQGKFLLYVTRINVKFWSFILHHILTHWCPCLREAMVNDEWNSGWKYKITYEYFTQTKFCTTKPLYS